MLIHTQNNVSMANYVSLRCGGVAKYFYSPKTFDELAMFLASNTRPILFLGLGSNLLIQDTGFSGVVIQTKYLNNLQIKQNIIQADAGVSLAKLSRFSKQNQQYGAEFFSTIPGTVGGALVMNAGCFNYQTWQWVTRVKTIDIKGKQHQRYKQDFTISYRKVVPKYPDEYFLGAEFMFSNNSVEGNIKSLLLKRQKNQPIGLASCGSVFINPNTHYAGALIEQAGLKGFCVGDACVSNKHANFIINQNNATATNVQDLISHIQSTVIQKFGIKLVTEVKII